MGYTPRTMEAIAEIIVALHDIERGPHADDGWAPGARLMTVLRTTSHLSESGIRARITRAIALGLVERRDNLPEHIDQRTSYYRTTLTGLQTIRQAKLAGAAAAAAQPPGQTILEPINDRT